jgi:ribosomal protein L11 methyltransferase
MRRRASASARSRISCGRTSVGSTSAAATAILALVACHRGAIVDAVDHDPEAVRVAREVVVRNGLEARISVRCEDAGASADRRWDGIVANLDERTLVRLAPTLAATIRPGGALVGAGFLDADVPTIEAALVAAGIEPREVRHEAGWAALIAVRSG